MVTRTSTRNVRALIGYGDAFEWVSLKINDGFDEAVSLIEKCLDVAQFRKKEFYLSQSNEAEIEGN